MTVVWLILALGAVVTTAVLLVTLLAHRILGRRVVTGIELHPTGMKLTGLRGPLGFLAWEDLEEVSILNTDTGPIDVDVYWELRDCKGRVYSIPQDASGSGALLEKFQLFPGFDNAVVIQAMGRTDKARATCWKKTS